LWNSDKRDRYNAPEVLHQKTTPISGENLHKCDIWSYGLLVWEILGDGTVFFQTKWRQESAFARSLEKSPSLQITEVSGRQQTDDCGSAERSIDIDKEGVLGTFDVKHLKSLAKQFVDSYKGFSSGFEKSYLKPVFERTLQVDPAARLSDLTRLPIFGIWNKTSGVSTAQSRVAVYAGTSQFTYEIFGRDHGRHILWGHQKQMLQDFESVSTQRQLSSRSNPAAFQSALCFLNGFGTSCDHTKASQHLRRADEAEHPVAKLLGDRLLSVAAHLPIKKLQPYAAIAQKGFLFARKLDRFTTFTVHETLGEVMVSDQGSRSDASITFSDYSSFQDFLQGCPRSRLPSLSLSTASSNVRINLLEAAIAFNDETLVHELITLFDVTNCGAWGETPLIQAVRHGNPDIIRTLLDAGSEARQRTKDQVTVFHWLFCFVSAGDDILDSIFEQVKRAPEILDLPCTAEENIHHQWPLSVRGTPLAVAISVGSLEAVQKLLEHGADPLAPAFRNKNVELDWKWTPIHLAVRFHMPAILSCLIAKASELRGDLSFANFPPACAFSYITPAERYAVHGTQYLAKMRETLSLLPEPISLTSLDGERALLRAIDFEDPDVVGMLLERNPELGNIPFKDPANPSAFTFPLHFAAHVGSCCDSQEAVRIIEQILSTYDDATNARDSNGRTPLFMAASGITSRITELLLQKGAYVDASDHSGQTALHCCRFRSNTALLLENGADIDHLDHNGFAPIHVAAKAALEQPLQELIEKGADLTASKNAIGTPLHCAVHNKSRAAVTLLSDNGANIDAQNQDKSTPLLLAIDSGRMDLAILLLDLGAYPFLTNVHGQSPLRAAVHSPSVAVLRRILNHDASVLEKAELGSILHEAAKHAPMTLLQELIRQTCQHHLVDIDALDQMQRTPLHTAALAARPDAAKCLLDNGASVNKRDINGNTPLVLACQSRGNDLAEHGGSRTSTCKVLMARGADILAENKDGSSALLIAQSYLDFSLMTFLIETAVSLSLKFNKHWSPNNMIAQQSPLRILLDNAPISGDLVSRAFKNEEWDFITTCIAARAISSATIGRVFGQDKSAEMEKLTDFARRGNRHMVRLILMAEGPEYARPPGVLSQYFWAGLTGDVSHLSEDITYSEGDQMQDDPIASTKPSFQVKFDGPDDPLNPKNWPGKKKWEVTHIVTFFTFLSCFASTMIAPALDQIGMDLDVSNTAERQLVLSVFVLAHAVGPFILGPLSEIYGRSIILLTCNVIFTAFNTASGFATSKRELIILRFFAGLGCSAPLSVGGAVIGDLFNPQERGTAMSIYAMGPLLGPSIGPMIGAWIAGKTTWRWIFWTASIVNIPFLLAHLFRYHESYAPYLLHKKAQAIREQTADPRWHAEGQYELDQHAIKKLRKTTARTLKMLITEPIIQLMTLSMAFSYGVLYLLLATSSQLFITEYHESTGISGLNYISLGLGMLIGAPACGKLNDKNYRRLKARHPRGQGQPEFRIPLALPFTFLMPLGLLTYGWSIDGHLHWTVPNIGLFIFAVGTISIFQCVTTYIVDSYTRFAASAVAGITILRSLAGFGFPAFAPALYTRLGHGIGNTVLATMAIGIQMLVLPLIWAFGSRLRSKSAYTAKTAEIKNGNV
jgi:multidrug resistance protein